MEAAKKAAKRSRAVDAILRNDPASLPALIAEESDLRDESITWQLLKYWERFYFYLEPATQGFIVEAAVIACSYPPNEAARADAWRHRPEALVQAWKAKSTVLRLAAKFEESELWLRNAREHVRQYVRDDARDLYLAHLDFAYAMIAWDRRQSADAIGMFALVHARYMELDSPKDADRVGFFYADIAVRLRRFDEALAYFERRLEAAQREHDEVRITMALAGLAECWLGLKDFGRARAAINDAIEICRTYEMSWAEARVAGTAAQIAICIDGTTAGLVAMDAARRRCVDLGMPGQAVRILLYGVETICEVLEDVDAPELEEMCRTIQVEASALNLPADVAEATERLRSAAARHRISRHDIEGVLAKVAPGAKYANESVTTH